MFLRHKTRPQSLPPRRMPRFGQLMESLEGRTLMTVIPVNTFADVVNSADGQTSLREALALAATKNGTAHITLPAGTYPLVLGELEINDAKGDVRIEATGSGATIDAQGISRVFEIDSGSTAQFSKLTLTGGAADRGGAIFISGTLTLQNSNVHDNNGAIQGGGINLTRGSKLTLQNSSVHHNVGGSDGGGIANFGGVVTVQNSSIDHNTAFSGGGIVNATGDEARGISAAPGTIVLTNSSVSDNTASGDGAGIFNGSSAALTLTNCTVSGNTGVVFGGGIDNFGTLKMTGCIVSGNLATSDGGGIRNASIATLKNCTVTNNTAASGGGIWNDGTFGTLTLIGTTFSGNTPDDLFQS